MTTEPATSTIPVKDGTNTVSPPVDDDDDAAAVTVPSGSAPHQPVKPALSRKDGKSRKSGKGSASRKKGDIHLKWDEAKIREHDQLRGTRMKIDEPNTPYNHYDSGSETDGSIHSAKHLNRNEEERTNISWATLQNKLEAHAAVRDAYPPSSPSSHGGGVSSDNNYRSDDGEGEETDKELLKEELKQLEFKEHRKRHYNEMELVRKYRQEHANDDGHEDELEDEDGGDDADDEHDE